MEATDPEPGSEALEVSVNDGVTFAGSYVRGSSVIDFEVRAVTDQHAVLVLEVNGARIDVDLDLGTQKFRQDGHLNALYGDDLAALLGLRDALHAQYPDFVTGTLAGKLLARHADMLAEAPVGHTLAVQAIDIQAAASRATLVDRADADGCGGDGVTCLNGNDGYDYAVYDPGSNGTCVWKWAKYGKNAPSCNGRCGAGCSSWDDNYTWDCFDHDKCLDAYGGTNYPDNPNCGDEFNDAVDDYVVTYNPWAC